jgi:hypothetical protein
MESSTEAVTFLFGIARINKQNSVFSTRGHFGPFSTDCGYWIRADTVFLQSSPADQQADKDFMTYTDTLYIYRDSCLLDRNKHFHYCIQASDTLFAQD